jgi:hypothetical protein
MLDNRRRVSALSEKHCDTDGTLAREIASFHAASARIVNLMNLHIKFDPPIAEGVSMSELVV